MAPEELMMPEHYIERMKKNGFEVRTFSSIEEYLNQKDVAKMWYFTRLQLERMGEDILEKVHLLREAVTFRKEFLEKLPEGVKFYHPLPRHKLYPTIPNFLDSLPLNGWETQARNGYWVRIVLLSMFGGAIEAPFDTSKKAPEKEEDFIIPAPIVHGTRVFKKTERGE